MDLLNLLVKITADSGDAEKTVSGLAGKVKSGLGVAGKVAGAAIAAVGAATVTIGKQALEAYGDYEQLAGGIQTLYGENSEAAQMMMDNASKAWQTAGMSANEYMETAIQSSAALINSLGGDTEKAAELMDMSITDMSDNVNKMGTNMESVQNAYRGFSRGNFTMLDNLALGFAGTKEGMQELLDKAAELSGFEYDISSYSDIVEAIHVVQTEMGITGTTAKEASETIQGSVNAMKAAWKNLVTGLADENADLDKLMDNFVGSIETVGKNIIPKIKTILKGVSKLINSAVKELLPMIIQVIVDSLPDLVTAGVELIVALLQGIAQAIPQLIAAVPDIIAALVNALKENWPAIKEAGGQIIEALVLGIVDMGWYLGTAIADLFSGLGEKIKEYFAPAVESTKESVASIVESVKTGYSTVKRTIEETIGHITETLKSRYEEMLQNQTESFGKRLEAVKQYIQDAKQRISEFSENLKSLIKDAMQWLYDHTIGKLVEVANGIKEKLALVKQHFQDLIDAAYVWGQDLIVNFADGIANMFPHLAKAVNWVTEKISGLLGHSHPKEGPLADDYKWMPDMMQLFAKGIKDNAHLVTDQIEKNFDLESMVKPSASPFTDNRTSGASTINNYNNITVNGIEELEEVLRWFESRQVVARMA